MTELLGTAAGGNPERPTPRRTVVVDVTTEVETAEDTERVVVEALTGASRIACFTVWVSKDA